MPQTLIFIEFIFGRPQGLLSILGNRKGLPLLPFQRISQLGGFQLFGILKTHNFADELVARFRWIFTFHKLFANQ
jgi:hypothetical protein